jgi:hypothetical protein
MSADHKQVATSMPGVEVDEKLAALIEGCWAAKIDTDLSCQGDQGEYAWIQFYSVLDAESFLKLAVPAPKDNHYEGDTLYNRAYRVWSNVSIPGDTPVREYDYANDKAHQAAGLWKVSCNITDMGNYPEPMEGDPLPMMPVTPHFSIGLRFPQTDIPELTKNIQR